MKKKKVGFVLGTFDPVHIGHLYLAAKSLNDGLVDEAVFVPTVKNPWKKEPPTASWYERLAMLREAIEPLVPNASVSAAEASLKPPYYSWKTLAALFEEYPDEKFERFVICGADVIESVDRWMNYDSDIRGKYKFIGFQRGGKTPENPNVDFQLVKSDIPGVSSSALRKLMKEGKTPCPWVPDSNCDMCRRIYGPDGF